MSTFLRAYRLGFSNIYLLHHARLTGAELALHFMALSERAILSSWALFPCLLRTLTTKPGMAAVIAPTLSAADNVPSLRLLVFF